MDIPFTFGIVTYADNGVNKFLPKIINSIRNLNIPQYEIIIVGNKKKLNSNLHTTEKNNDIKLIDFDESIRNKWITKKKNLITQHAKYDNIVYQHDYISYDRNWYTGYKKFGGKFNICMNKIVNNDGSRYRDWVVFPFHHAFHAPEYERLWEYTGIANNQSMLPYDELHFTRWQYISGAYWVAKKHVMQKFPLNESLLWGQGEDCEWSQRVKKEYTFSLNVNSTVHLLKWHQDAFNLIRPKCLAKMAEYLGKIKRGDIK